MSTQVTVTLPDNVYQHVERFAQLAGYSVAEILATMLEVSAAQFNPPVQALEPVQALSDDAVLALSESQMEAAQDSRLSELLYKQQAGDLSQLERVELQALMQVYQEGLLRKAQALAEAVRRGLREPLEP
jgi:hypothetical protein